MLDRPIIHDDFTAKYQQIVTMLIEEVDTIEVILIVLFFSIINLVFVLLYGKKTL